MPWLFALLKNVLESQYRKLTVSVSRCRGVFVFESRYCGLIVSVSRCRIFLALESRCRDFLLFES